MPTGYRPGATGWGSDYGEGYGRFWTGGAVGWRGGVGGGRKEGSKAHIQMIIGRREGWRRGGGQSTYGVRANFGGGECGNGLTPPLPGTSAQEYGPNPGGKRGRFRVTGGGQEPHNIRWRGY